MRLLRDSTLTIWLLIAAAMVAVFAVSSSLGSQREVPVLHDTQGTTASVIGAHRSRAAAEVDKLRQLSPHAVAAGADAAALSEFAGLLADGAREAVLVRESEGAHTGDALWETLTNVAGLADQLAAHSHDRVRAASLRTHILIQLDRAHALVSGLPVPDQVPGVPGAPLVEPDPRQPTPPTPATPSATPAQPPAPTPTLDLTRPRPEDL